ncbi:EAL domain-containing protein [Ferriphaselus sp. R-1]|uniref:bifunctional diguanylate cyclase/phosphodiesterase n=1 Tax=Ferriphaselus sp. R-1 TaxID=1485544 RepID=UPI0006892B87|nr:EAL domain-containing protein [Ferriphaselus sp. R-1]
MERPKPLAGQSAGTQVAAHAEQGTYADTSPLWLIPLVAVLVAWGVLVDHVVDRHFEAVENDRIVASQKRVQHDVVGISSALQRRLETVRGATRLMVQARDVVAVLKHSGSDVRPSSQGREANIQRWGADPELVAVSRHLGEAADALGLDVIYVLNAAGDCIASSNAGDPDQFIGGNYADRQYFQQSQQGLIGQQYAVGKVSNIAGLYFSSPVIVDGKFIGAVAAKRNLYQLAYLVQQDDSFLVDENGVVILASNKAFEMHALAGAEVDRLSRDQRLSRYRVDAFPVLRLEPWGKDLPRLQRLNGQSQPMVVSRHEIAGFSFQVYSFVPLYGLLDQRSARDWFKLAGFAIGTLLLLLGVGGWMYLRNAHRSRALIDASERSYRGIFNSLEEAIYVQDAQGRFLDINDGVLKMYGHPREFFIGHTPEIVSAPGLNDATSIAQQVALAYAGEAQAFEFWAVRANGEVFPKEVHLYPGEHFGQKVVIAIAQDITERKRMEEARQLAQLVYQHTSEGLMVCDADNHILAVNPAFTETTGYTFEEVQGKTPRILHSGRQPPEFYRAMWEQLGSEGHWQGEIWNRRKSGEIFPEWLVINTIYHSGGSVDRRVGIFSDISARKQSEELIWRQANFDTLTELPNRRMFRDRLRIEVSKAHREGHMLALLFIDLDRFKEVNDTLGHEAGDQLLVQAALRITACLRETDTVARLGGDEFTVILPGLNDCNDVERIAQTLITRLSEPFTLLDIHEAYVSASIGIAIYPDDGQDESDLIKHADQAMYAAKAGGRNRYSYFTHALQEVAQNRLRLANALRGALEFGQMHVVFQPIVRLSDGHIHKAEALLRWQHPVRGFVSPAEFIPLAEEIGLIGELGNWVFRQSMDWVQRWHALHQGELQVSVNMSPLQFHGADTSQSWDEYLSGAQLTGHNVIIEITEGLLLHADPSITDKLLRYRDLGIQVAIDDFGTGYSSLAYLRKFDIDYLKIDQAFVRPLDEDVDSQVLVEAIVVMAHKLGLKVIAEGVETEAQRDFLRGIGCDYGQGYVFSRPVQPEAFTAVLERNAQSEV